MLTNIYKMLKEEGNKINLFRYNLDDLPDKPPKLNEFKEGNT